MTSIGGLSLIFLEEYVPTTVVKDYASLKEVHANQSMTDIPLGSVQVLHGAKSSLKIHKWK